MDKGKNNPDMREPAKYYEPLYFYNGQTTLTDEMQNFIVEALDKNAAVGIFGIYEEEGYPIYCMSGFAMTNLGYTFDELMNVTDGKFINLVYEKDRQLFLDAYHEVETPEMEFRLNARDKVIWVNSYRIRSVPLDGKMVSIASARVIDDSVRRESDLLAALAREYSEIIYVDENKGKCRRVKRGVENNEPIGTIEELWESLERHMDAIHPDDQGFAHVYEKVRQRVALALEASGDCRAIYRAYLNGKYVWLQFRAVFGGNMHLDTGHAILMFKKVDQEVQNELDANCILSESLARAEQADRIKNQFLTRMSHDLRTPLNGITGMVEILKRNAGNPDKVIECSEKIQRSCQHLMSLVEAVLDMSNLENGRMEFAEVPFDFQTMLDERAKYIMAQADVAGITYHIEIEPFKHRNIIGSPRHIGQIFANIIDNAIRYNKPGGSIYVRGREVSDSDRLAVFEFEFEDTGRGMDNDFLKRIFEPFEQEHNDARTNYAGTGLGMSIVKGMIDQMNGDISVKSIKDVGTTVSITLPFRVCNEEEQESDIPEAGQQEIDLTGMKALLVEDNELNMEIAQFLLEDIGIEVYGAENGQIAVDMFRQSEEGFYDVVFMDLLMPVMDGYEATKQIRAMARGDAQIVPIIALSANVLDANIKRSIMAGINEHLAKPINASQILKAILKYTRKVVKNPAYE